MFSFLQQNNQYYISKKANVILKEEVERFLLEAPEDNWLSDNFWLLSNALLSLKMKDLEDTGKYASPRVLAAVSLIFF